MFVLFFQFVLLFFISCVLKILIEDFFAPLIKVLLKLYKLPQDLFFIIFFTFLKSIPELIYSSLWALLSPSSTTLPYKATSLGSGISLFAIFSSSMIAFGFIQPLCVLLCNSNKPHNKYYEKNRSGSSSSASSSSHSGFTRNHTVDEEDEVTVANTTLNSSSRPSSFNHMGGNLNITGSLSNDFIPSRRKNKKKKDVEDGKNSFFFPSDSSFHSTSTLSATSIPSPSSSSSSFSFAIEDGENTKYSEKKNMMQKFKNFFQLLSSKFTKNPSNSSFTSSSASPSVSSNPSSFFLSFIKPKYVNTQIQRNPTLLFGSFYSIRKEIKLAIRPIVRETFFFVLLLLLFVFFMSDRFLNFHEALILFFCFILYAAVILLEILLTRDLSINEEKDMDMSNLHSIESSLTTDLPQFQEDIPGLKGIQGMASGGFPMETPHGPDFFRSNPIDSSMGWTKKRSNSSSTHESFDYSDVSDDLESEIPNLSLMSEDVQDATHPWKRNKWLERCSSILSYFILSPIRQVLIRIIPAMTPSPSFFSPFSQGSGEYSSVSLFDSSFNDLNSLSTHTNTEKGKTGELRNKDGSIISSVLYSILAVPDPKKGEDSTQSLGKLSLLHEDVETLTTANSTMSSPIPYRDSTDLSPLNDSSSLSDTPVQSQVDSNLPASSCLPITNAAIPSSVDLQFSDVSLLNSPNELILTYSSNHSKIRLFSIFFICLGIFSCCSFLIHIVCKSLSLRFQSRSSVFAAIILVLCSELMDIVCSVYFSICGLQGGALPSMLSSQSIMITLGVAFPTILAGRDAIPKAALDSDKLWGPAFLMILLVFNFCYLTLPLHSICDRSILSKTTSLSNSNAIIQLLAWLFLFILFLFMNRH